MLNVGGPEVLVILLVALIVLGPQQLPKAVRSVGNVMSELRRMSSGFQEEIRSALDVSGTDTQSHHAPAKLAQRPEDADITETIARNTDVDPIQGQPPDAGGAADAASFHGSSALTNPSASELRHDHDDWVPSDRASG